MSFKAYDYFITDLSPFELTSRVRPVLDEIFLTKFAKGTFEISEALPKSGVIRFVDLESDLYVAKYFKEREICKGFVEFDFYDYVMMLYNSSKHTFSNYDFGYEFVMLAGPDGKTVCKVFSEDDIYLNKLGEFDFLSDFSYWDNADPDENVSESDWEYRERFWDQVSDDSPADNGIGFSHPSKFKSSLFYYNFVERKRAEKAMSELVKETEELNLY